MSTNEIRQDEIIRMAWEAGLGEPVNHDQWDADLPRLERFASLVASHEREACAKVCEELDLDWRGLESRIDCAAAIRARGE